MPRYITSTYSLESTYITEASPYNTVKNQQNKFKYAPRIEPNNYKYVSYFRLVAI